jgi:DNA-directed RNA polymerase specialized sigma24 family protein
MEPNWRARSVPGVEIVTGSANGSTSDLSLATATSFEAFWSAQRGPLGRALALTLGDRQLAGDAVDEAMARAYQHWPHVGTLANPGGWVYRVGLNWSRSFVRRARRTPPSWMIAHSAAAPIDMREPAIDAALAALPLTQRSVVVCRLLLGLSEAQTAAALRLRPGTVKSRLSRAVAQLSTALAHLDPNDNNDSNDNKDNKDNKETDG